MRVFALLLCLLACGTSWSAEPRPIRVLFLGHESEHHNSNAYYPMLAKALGPDGIYFDYTTSVARAFDPESLNRFDALLLYANHNTMTVRQLDTLIKFVERGGGFLPIHSASACFTTNEKFIELVGARFQSHKAGTFAAKIVKGEHPAMKGVEEFEAWDETYVHSNHNTKGRTVLMERVEGEHREPWTWVREQGKGRVFYTASGHDQRVWKHSGFHQLLKSGILWAVGDTVRKEYETFMGSRAKLKYEKRDNIPNYERRPEPLPYQLPLTAEESMQHIQAPIEFKLELFASEPQIVNPIYLAWDERGRLWVAETRDYPNEIDPNQKGRDTIKILEDTDGDGKCDNVKVFAEGLNIPTSLTFSNGGIIVAQAPDFLFLKDTNGDDKADVRKVLFSGWGTFDTHAGPSNLRYGFDNWIYGAVGYARFNGTLAGKNHNWGSGIFRFKPDGSDIEFLYQYNNNTWGLGFNQFGDVFGSTANRNPSFFGGFPATAYKPGKKGMSAKMIAKDPGFYPITPNIRQVDAFNQYTAAAGHALATSNAFPEEMRNTTAFVCGPTGHLLGRYELQREGSGYKAKNGYNFLASTDEWFSPVAAEVGPDGHLWVADWYNFIIQHNPTPNANRGGYNAKNGKGNAHINPNRDRQHGRIYRVVWDKAPEPKTKSLKGAGADQLVAALEDPNLFWRSTAQRLIVEQNLQGAVPALKSRLKRKGVGAIHALWALEGLKALDEESHRGALLAQDAAVRRNAVRALPHDAKGQKLLFESGVVSDPDPTTKLAAFVALNRFPKSDPLQTAVAGLMKETLAKHKDDSWLKLALENAGGAQGLGFTGKYEEGKTNLLTNGDFEKKQGSSPLAWKVRNYNGAAEHNYVKEGRNGGWCVRIDSKTGSDTSFYTPIKLKPNTRYRFTGWFKTKDVKGAIGGLMNVHELQKRAWTKGLKGTHDWTKLSSDFDSATLSNGTLNALFGGWGRSTGTVWYDDFRLVELKPVIESTTVAEVKAGDATRGKEIFLKHPVAACSRCHVVDGVGGPVGPKLDGIGTRKDEAYLRESLVEPNKTIAKEYTASPISPMPPMDVLLTKQELEDVLAYLKSLK